MNKIKQARFQATIQRLLTTIIQTEAHNQHLKHLVVTDVKVTADGSQAKVYYQVLSGESKPLLADALAHANHFLRYELAQRLDTRKVPTLIFVYDESLDRGNRIDALIKAENQKLNSPSSGNHSH